MRSDDELSTSVKNVFDGRDGFTNSCVIGDDGSSCFTTIQKLYFSIKAGLNYSSGTLKSTRRRTLACHNIPGVCSSSC